MVDLRGALGMVGGACRGVRVLAAFVFLFLLLPAAGRATTYVDPQVRWWGGGATLLPDAGAACAANYSGGSLCVSAYGVTSPALYDPSASYYPGHAWAFCSTPAWPCSQGPQVAVYTTPVCAAGWKLVTLPNALGQYMIVRCQPVVDCPEHASGTPCSCDTGYEWDANHTSCVQEQYALALTPKTATIEPGETYPLTATVTKQGGGAPGKPVTVSVKVAVDPTSGGHDHGETYATRPKGSVSPDTGNTSFPITFTSTEVSGTHTITATCDLCVNKAETATVDVMVPGLETIPASPFYAFVGAVEGNHTRNHYLIPPAELVLHQMALSYQWLDFSFRIGGVALPPLHLNDASLVWGGKFDVKGKWTGDHKGHKRGVVIDVRANNDTGSTGAISLASFGNFIDMAATQKNRINKNGAVAQVHCTSNKTDGQNRKPPACIGKDGSQDNNRHFHILLLGVDQ